LGQPVSPIFNGKEVHVFLKDIRFSEQHWCIFKCSEIQHQVNS